MKRPAAEGTNAPTAAGRCLWRRAHPSQTVGRTSVFLPVAGEPGVVVRLAFEDRREDQRVAPGRRATGSWRHPSSTVGRMRGFLPVAFLRCLRTG